MKRNYHKSMGWVLVLLLVLLISGCGSSQGDGSPVNETPETSVETEPVESETSGDLAAEEEESRQEESSSEILVDPASVGADESGQVMVLMYHHIREPEAEWSRTPENFWRDLEVLYEKGFRPIRLIDYARGHIDVPAGKSPVVLTFDDGNQNNFNYLEEPGGEWILDPDSAVGVLMAFHDAHPDFVPHATFFINGGTPFGQGETLTRKLQFLVDNGMDIGNHTETHLHLGEVTADRLQRELTRIQQLVDRHVPGYRVNTFSLPFGSRPSDESVAPYVVDGRYDGVTYQNEAVLEVGWDPYHSPFHQEFDPLRIRRVRASETKVDGVGMYDWLASFESGSRRRFISDGNPQTISIPLGREDVLREDLDEYEIITY